MDTTTRTEERVAQLRTLAETQPTAAADAVENWLLDLKQTAQQDLAAATAELDAIYATGTAGLIDGRTDGDLLVFLPGPVNKAIGVIGKFWMPWVGKQFDAENGGGRNRLNFLPVPFRRRDLVAVWFDSRVDHRVGQDVLVLEYGNAASDELVEIVPGMHLGKGYANIPGRGNVLAAYFTLRVADST